jgi:hypothetical protein
MMLSIKKEAHKKSFLSETHATGSIWRGVKAADENDRLPKNVSLEYREYIRRAEENRARLRKSRS